VVRQGEAATIKPIRSEYIVDELIARLPDVPAAYGKPISVLESDYSGPGASGASGPSYMDGPPSARHQEARRLDALLRAPRIGAGRLYAARLDRAGRRVRSADWVAFLDLEPGRWVTYRVDGAQPSINAVPATPHVIAGRLTALR